ncbi:hypothetical protein ALNOE001_05410 [Candidatus Methanobinarius endosymbioticus]|uniref:Right handed beta helix domain-containing protein n=1 Tax=Candidatus Methanobinarius endosymbioticus TaxID=2006182 RepID=A0A366MDV8_9EURY|nr:hypothetical protein ALNOE001_05410 [Candidatus Methanobinarius endosymbioticus]
MTIYSSNFINNTAKSGNGIYIKDSENFNISYSRLVNKNINSYELVATDSNGVADYNWWGDNNGLSHTNLVLNNYYIMKIIINDSKINKKET